MVMSLNLLKRLAKEELTNMVLEYQSKFDNTLSKIITEFASFRDIFTKSTKSQFLVTRTVNDNFRNKNVIFSQHMLHMNSVLGNNVQKNCEFQTVFQIII